MLQQMDLMVTKADDEAMDRGTNKNRLLKFHEDLTNKPSSSGPTLTTGRKSSLPWVSKFPQQATNGALNLDPEKRVDISILSKKLDRILFWRYFLCRNITPPDKTSALMTVVDDPEGERAVRLVLYNYPTDKSKTLLQVLPIGTILAIQNPWFKELSDGLAVFVDDPTKVVVIDEKSMQKLFPNLQWKSDIPEKYRNLIPSMNPKTSKEALKYKDEGNGLAVFVDDPNPTKVLVVVDANSVYEWKSDNPEKYRDLVLIPSPKPKTSKEALKYKEEGNKFYADKNYSKAVKVYTAGLRVEPDCIEILSNRAAAYLNLEYFYRSLEDVNKLLTLDCNHLKGNFRKAKSLWGLKRYDKAIKFLETVTTTNSELTKGKELINLLSKYRNLVHIRRSGNYDWKTIFEGKVKQHVDFVDYTGPVITSPNMPQNKGRGLIVTQDVPPGTLLLACKALSIFYHEHTRPENLLGLDAQGHIGLVKTVVEKLRAEPEYGKDVYKLCPGQSMCWQKLNRNKVDMGRVNEICCHNAFGGNSICATENKDNYMGNNKTGLWLLPSYINHSCWDSNCTWTTSGDVIIIRSFKNIAEGEEILISYVNPLDTLTERLLGLKHYNFCQQDRKDSKTVRVTRLKILEAIDCNPGDNTWLRRQIWKLEDLRRSNPSLNTAIVFPLFRMAQVYFVNGEIQKSVDSLIKAYDIAKNAPLIAQPIDFVLNIMSAFIASKEKDQIEKWLQILKQDLIIRYGSLEVINIVCKDYLDLLQAYGVHSVHVL